MNEEIIISSPSDEQLSKLNWPALAFPWIWCFFHRLYFLGFISLIPIVGIIMGFYLLFKGNRLDWERNKDRGAEIYFTRRKKWNRVTAIIFVCLFILGLLAVAYEELGFSWRQYSFENEKLTIRLPFELKNKNNIVNNEKVAYGRSYQADNGQMSITISFTELNAEYEFDLREMFSSSLDNLKSAKDIQIANHSYKEFKNNDYPAGKMSVDFISEGIKLRTDYIYVLVANNKLWYLSTTFKTNDKKSNENSEKIFNSVQIK